MFLPTASEISLLQVISSNPGIGVGELLGMAELQGKERALQGCVAKGYVEVNGCGRVWVTDTGASCT